MIASIIAYALSAVFVILAFAFLAFSMRGKTSPEKTFVSFILFIVLSVIGWGFAYLGGMS